ncbi:MAG: hypothetical protein NTU97_04540, partial [Candidatus Magasanikbacteria bacterium]|nr:hypothetical protein [Candidatus Magasanikbacteria bacterium]
QNPNPTTEDIYKRAEELGLKLCPAEVGIFYILQNNDQPISEHLNIGMEPISRAYFGSNLFVFRLDSSHYRKKWNGVSSDYFGLSHVWFPDEEIIFCIPK